MKIHFLQVQFRNYSGEKQEVIKVLKTNINNLRYSQTKKLTQSLTSKKRY